MTAARLYAIWAAVGPLVGVIIGAWLTARWQHKRWILDNKKEEYRGILDALHAYRWQATLYLRSCGAGSAQPVASRQMAVGQNALAEALNSVWATLSDRIFIREALANSTVHQGLQSLHHSVVSGTPPTLDQWMKSWYELHRKLLRMARKDLRLGKHIPWSDTVQPVP